MASLFDWQGTRHKSAANAVPFSKALEDGIYSARARLSAAVDRLLRY